MKLPIYFEAYGSIGIMVSFYDREKGSTVSMLLAECPDKMRKAVNANKEHFVARISGYELKRGKYVDSPPIKV